MVCLWSRMFDFAARRRCSTQLLLDLRRPQRQHRLQRQEGRSAVGAPCTTAAAAAAVTAAKWSGGSCAALGPPPAPSKAVPSLGRAEPPLWVAMPGCCAATSAQECVSAQRRGRGGMSGHGAAARRGPAASKGESPYTMLPVTLLL